MSPHSPGPWVVNVGEHAHITNPLYKGLVCVLSDGLFVVNPDDHAVTDEETERNAHLLSAALDMRDALQSVIQVLGEGDLHYRAPRLLRRIKAALAKAEPAHA